MTLGIGVARGRCVAVWGAATMGAGGLVAGSLPVALAGPGDSFDVALVWGCAGAVAAATCWLWVVATVVTIDALRGLETVRRRGIPAVVRTALLVLGGAAIAGGLASPVVAVGQGPVGPHVLAGLRLPERVAVGPAAGAPVVTPAVREVRVAPGDTLWDIAARRLGAGASWPAIYALNRDVIGPDPGVIRPGQRLALPSLPSQTVGGGQ
jgi:nucleoid-associated protein YgaU